MVVPGRLIRSFSGGAPIDKKRGRKKTCFYVGLILLLSSCGPGPQPLEVTRDASSAEETFRADWSSFLMDLAHSSVNEQANAITPDNAADLIEVWRWEPDPPTEEGQPPAQLFSSPVVSGGAVFIGSNTGDFYALNQATGEVLWKQFLGWVEEGVCGRRGVTSTATVAADPSTGKPTVYVGGADGHLHALDAADGAELWKARVIEKGDDGHVWSSPTVVDGRIYIGVAGHCKSTVRGGVKLFDQATGQLVASYWTVTKGEVGGSVWSASATPPDAADVFVSTGNAAPGHPAGDSYSIVRLDAADLQKKDIWTAPLAGTDLDFGGSPTLFLAEIEGASTPMVGSCNKNGHYYALQQDNLSEGPVWEVAVSGKWPDEGNCLGAAVWDDERQRLFVAGAQTSIGGEPYRGSVRQLDPATGAPIWELGLPGAVWGNFSMNGAGILAVPSFDTEPDATRGIFLVDASEGKLIATVETADSPAFAQPVFADRFLFVATIANGLIVYDPDTE